MQITPLAKKLMVVRGEYKKIFNYLKSRLPNISCIASSVNWDIHYAIYKPSKPSKEELEWLKKEINELKTWVGKVKKFAFTNKGTVETIEERLKHMEEEFVNYPFSDRKKFFYHRINFLKHLIKRNLEIL